MPLRSNTPLSSQTQRVPLPADMRGPSPPPPPKYYVSGTRKPDSNPCLIVALVVGGTMFFVFAIMTAILLPALGRAREAARRASCAGNLKQVAMVCTLYANENPNGYWPPLSSEEGRFMFTPESVYPDFMSDTNVLACPSDTDATEALDAPGEQAIDDHSYYYLGYALSTEEEAVAFLENYPRFIAEGADFTQDLPAPRGKGSFGGDTFLRLREDVCEDTGVLPAAIPVMFDSRSSSGSYGTFNHLPGGANVLFLDGHVEWIRYPGEFPVSMVFMDTLSSLDEATARPRSRWANE